MQIAHLPLFALLTLLTELVSLFLGHALFLSLLSWTIVVCKISLSPFALQLDWLFYLISTWRSRLQRLFFMCEDHIMMGPKRWQQRRTGRAKRRLQYTNFIFILSDCNSTLVARQGDSSESSSDKARLTERTHPNFSEIVRSTSRGSLTCLTSDIGNTAFAEAGFSSQSELSDCADGPDTFNSETDNVWVNAVHASAVDKEFPTKNIAGDVLRGDQEEVLLYRSWNHSTQKSHYLGKFWANQVNAISMDLQNERSIPTKDEEQEQRRGTRKRKPKVHFGEEERSSQKPHKNRRIKIMRHLGLAAPYGSPFINNCVKNYCLDF